MPEHVEEIEIVRAAHGGDGVGYLDDGRIIFVPRALPGDVAKVRVTQLKSSFARGEIEELVEPADYRTEAECPYFEDCGGCQYWHAEYDGEFDLKVDAAFETLKRISHLTLPEPERNPAPSDRRYRSRVTFHRKRVGEHPWMIGFYKRGTDELVEIHDCLITSKPLNDARRALEPALRDIGDADLILETAGDGKVVATIVPEDYFHKAPPSLRDFTNNIANNELISGLRLIGDKEDLVFGDTTIEAGEILAKPPVESARLPSSGFRQAFPEVNDMLVDAVSEIVEREGSSSVLEFYCGNGNFSFAMPGNVRRLVGLEANPTAVQSATGLAKMDTERHYVFERMDLSEGFLEDLDQSPAQFDLVLLDPPREGASAVCAELARYDHFDAIVYVSCDPACLARDLKTLEQGGWVAETVSMYDMFPRTAHIETLVVLRQS
ncbi:MAG: class I SAM-dependent RNA methyltransferase [Myxococcota bacterium]